MQWYLIGVADAPEGTEDFIAKVQKIEDGLILDGVNADMGEDHVWFEDRWMVASLCDE
jgi:hypothetical protein